MRVTRSLALALTLVTMVPAAARADGLFIPFIGVNFAGDSGKEVTDAIDAKRFNWGASLGYMGGGVLGLEAEFSHSPDFFGESDIGGSSVTTVMGNLLLGVPIGGQSGFGVRPYGLVGVGLIRSKVDALDIVEIEENQAGWDFGGGVMVFFGSVGVRADLRYFRTFEELDILGFDFLDGEGNVDFARASAGLVLRF